MRNVVVVVLDSCRYDSVGGNFTWLGEVEKRWSWASWTLPSHECFLSGLMPHKNERMEASVFFGDSFREWKDRLQVEFDIERFIPSFWLPTVLKELGYATMVLSSVPCLNPRTNLNLDLDVFRNVKANRVLKETSFDALTREFALEIERFEPPYFALLNCFDTHYPFGLELPRLSGIRGGIQGREEVGEFSDGDLLRMKRAQVEAVSNVDGKLSKLTESFFKGSTSLVVTSDHGELFGENGYFGHGPFFHEKLFEVPYVEGVIGKDV